MDRSLALKAASLFLLGMLLCSPAMAAEPKAAPPFSLWTLDRRLHTLSSLLEGKRFVVLSFFATWCAPCRAELPLLSKVHERFSGQGVEVVLLAVDEDRAKLEAFLKEHPLPLLVLSDPYAVAAKAYGLVENGLVRVPRTFVLDAAGRQVASFEASAELDQKLGALLAPKPEPTARSKKKGNKR